MNVSVRRSLQPLQIRYAAPLQRRLGEFWSWWTGELSAMLPANLHEAIAQRRQKLFLEADGNEVLINLGTYASSREILRLSLNTPDAANDELPRDVQQTILVMPADKVLTKPLTLPLAAEENLREVLGFEMDQHTPFPASKLYYDFVVTGRNIARQELSVDLVYSPQTEVDRLLEALSTHGLRADVITCRSRDGSNLRGVNLLPMEKRRSKRFDIRRPNLALTALCAVLLVAAITIPIVQKNSAIRSVEAQVEAAAIATREGSQLRQDLEKMADASRFLIQKKQSATLAVQLLDEISRILPDNTWVGRLDLSDTELQLQGQSKASSSLIAIIESSPYFENARFRSSVVQVAGTDADRFHLSADVLRSESQ